MLSLSSWATVAGTSTLSLFHPCTVTLRNTFLMRNAPSMPSGSRFSTLVCASVGVAMNNTATARPARPANPLAATCHLGCAAQQIDFLSIVCRQHIDQHFVGGITRQRIPRLEYRLVDRAEACLELRDSLRREHRLLSIKNLLQGFNSAEVVVLFDRKRGEAGGRAGTGCGNVAGPRCS